MRKFSALCLLLLTAVPLRAAEPVFSEVTDVVAVEVPVQVRDKDGEPVRGLTADDFEIYDGRKRMPVTGFEVLDLAAATPDRKTRAVPAAARRRFLLLFDLSFSEPKAILAARGAANDLVDGLHPADLVGVAVYAGSKGAQLVLRFTGDRQQIRAAIDSLGAPELTDRLADPLRLVVADEIQVNEDARGLVGDLASQFRGEAQQGKVDAVSSFLRVVAAESDKAERSARQRSVTAMMRSVGELAHMLGAIEGRKHVVLLSEGFDSSLIQGTSNQEEQDRMNASSQSGNIWEVDSEARYGSTRTVSDVEKMLEELRRADCVIQAVDIGGLKAGGNLGQQRIGGKDSLFMMARGTGGDFFENFNDLSAAMGEMLDRTSITYVLAFQPEDLKRDGSYHKVRVELKDGERTKGARVVHRPGYYAPRPYREQSAYEKLQDAAERVIAGLDSGELQVSVLAAPFRSASERAYVPVLLEVDGPRLLAGTPGGTLPAEVYVYAMDAAGAVRDHVTQTLGLDLAKVGPALRQSGLKFFGHLDLPPGDYSVRVLVRNGVTGASVLKTAAVQVPAFAQGPRVLLPPFFPEPAGKWLIVREAARQTGPDVPYPFMIGEEPYIPASLPVLQPGQETRLSLIGYNLGSGDLRLDARVLSADGREIGPADLRLIQRENGGPAGPDRLLATFRPQLPPGEYLLLVSLSGAEGAAGTSTAPFRIGTSFQNAMEAVTSNTPSKGSFVDPRDGS